MPDCSANYESEIEEGQNKRTIKCQFCSSVILTPSTASFISFEVRIVSYLLIILLYKIVTILVRIAINKTNQGPRSESRNRKHVTLLGRERYVHVSQCRFLEYRWKHQISYMCRLWGRPYRIPRYCKQNELCRTHQSDSW